MWNGSPEGMRPGANPVPLDEVRLSAKPTGLRWMGSLYTFEGVQPSIRTSEHLTRCGSAMTSTPPNWDHDRQRHQQPRFHDHDNIIRSPSQTATRRVGNMVPVCSSAWELGGAAGRLSATRHSGPFEHMRHAASDQEGLTPAQSKRAPVRTLPRQFNVRDPIETLFATDNSMHPSAPTGLHPAP